MKIVPLDALQPPVHFGYRGWLGVNPQIEVLAPQKLAEADFIWYCAWGDGEGLRQDMEQAKKYGKSVIFVVLGDHLYVPEAEAGNFYFVTHTRKNGNAHTPLQVQVPYSYHDSLDWWLSFDWRRAPYRDLLASFRGAYGTNPDRRKLEQLRRKDIHIEECDGWAAANRGDSSVLKPYSDLMLQSRFTLCPHGYGPSSIRVVEAIFRRSIPVLLDDDSRWFDDPMDFCVRASIKGDNIEHLIPILEEANKSYDERIEKMEKFLRKFLVVDHYEMCSKTIGYTEIIREKMKEKL